MPNWCDNNLTLTHDNPEMIARAIKAFEEGALLHEFIPVPKELYVATSPNQDNPDELRAKYGYADWFSFCTNEWGTKWDVGAEHIEKLDNNNINVYFQSAWSPPIEAYEKLEGLGFKINAYYHEPGMAYAGMYSDGNDESYEYGGMTPDQIRRKMPEIDAMFCIADDVEQQQEEIEE